MIDFIIILAAAGIALLAAVMAGDTYRAALIVFLLFVYLRWSQEANDNR